MTAQLKIGTRGSPLALAQATMLREHLVATGLLEPDAIETVIIRTSGDRIQDRSLAEIGGKGLFTKEIEEALLDGRVDLAVHSLKDLPAWTPEGLGLGAVLPRADPRDALLSRVATSISGLPEGARVGTSSPRRRALLLHRRPDLEIVELRGNVGTRLARLEAGAVDATLLAVAGLTRLAVETNFHPLDPAEMLPASSQGAVGIEIRLDDSRARSLCEAINCARTLAAVTAERAFLEELDGSCRTAIAALAVIEGEEIAFDGLIASPDGRELVRVARRGPAARARALGTEAGREARAGMSPAMMAAAGLQRG